MGFDYQKDAEGIVTVTMDMDGQSANTMNDQYHALMRETVEKLEAEKEMTGVVFASAKKTFFAGADLKVILTLDGKDKSVFDHFEESKGFYRRLEKLPVPVVAAINGAALGGGFELCMACNRRIVVDDPAAIVGFPEVTLGLLPGAGGVVRSVAVLGLEKALPVLLEGKPLKPQAALALGLIDEVIESRDALIPAAKAWIKANPDAGAQPWDQKGFKYPGGGADAPNVKMTASMAPTMLVKKTRGLMPAPEKILDVAVNSMRMGFDSALRNETRKFSSLVGTPESKAAITTFFFGNNAIKAGKFRPEGPQWKAESAAILGAGMMGAGIAWAHAKAGLPSTLLDTELANAEKGKAYSEKVADKLIARKRMSEADKHAILDRIRPTDAYDFDGVDIVIEAVFEDIAIKEKVIPETFARLGPDGIYGSNTSTLPISILAEACPEPERFIGVHFFSPVDRMPLVELIAGEKTSQVTIRKAYDYVRQIGKTPIVVSDSRGFFTSRVFGTFLNEGLALLQEGMAPAQIERASYLTGMPVGPLQINDEVTMSLNVAVFETHEALDKRLGITNGFPVENAALREIATKMTELGRIGRRAGKGFYDYDANGNRTLWDGLHQFARSDKGVPLADAKDRILYIQAIETLRCLHEGVLRSEVEANIGSIMGIGFPAYTGGAIQYIRGIGVDAFEARANALADTYGERFRVAPAVYDVLRATTAVAA